MACRRGGHGEGSPRHQHPSGSRQGGPPARPPHGWHASAAPSRLSGGRGSYRRTTGPHNEDPVRTLADVIGKILSALVHLDDEWALDVETAKAELGATGAQANVLAAHTLAWRVSFVLLPVALLVACLAALFGEKDPVAALVSAVALWLLGPQGVAMLLTVPVELWGSGQALFRGRDNFVRFGFTNTSYPYYGWRYAFCDRTRQWGALTHEERVAKDPRRAGVQTELSPRRNYWPE